MKGHYHLQVPIDPDDIENGTSYLNNADLPTLLAEAAALVVGTAPLQAAFICEFGCGLYHDLSPEEMTTIKRAFPTCKIIQLEGAH